MSAEPYEVYCEGERSFYCIDGEIAREKVRRLRHETRQDWKARPAGVRDCATCQLPARHVGDECLVCRAMKRLNPLQKDGR